MREGCDKNGRTIEVMVVVVVKTAAAAPAPVLVVLAVLAVLAVLVTEVAMEVVVEVVVSGNTHGSRSIAKSPRHCPLPSALRWAVKSSVRESIDRFANCTAPVLLLLASAMMELARSAIACTAKCCKLVWYTTCAVKNWRLAAGTALTSASAAALASAHGFNDGSINAKSCFAFARVTLVIPFPFAKSPAPSPPSFRSMLPNISSEWPVTMCGIVKYILYTAATRSDNAVPKFRSANALKNFISAMLAFPLNADGSHANFSTASVDSNTGQRSLTLSTIRNVSAQPATKAVNCSKIRLGGIISDTWLAPPSSMAVW
jgi:hypothetical protein